MAQESPRIAELRRRVQADPASIAFAQLAEEYRRAGHYQEAVKYCRAGLARHPGYLSARVTLGRALMELGELDHAAREFDLVLRSAPDNLAAVRGMAEIHQRRGTMGLALDYYKRALALARFDPELEESVNRIGREMGAVSAVPSHPGLSFEEAASQLLSAASRMPAVAPKHVEQVQAETPSAPVADTPRVEAAPASEPPLDFDALLASLGVPDASPPPIMEMLLSEPAAPSVRPDPVLPELPVEAPPADPFADLERELRAFDEPCAPPSADVGFAPAALDSAEDLLVDELEAWLRVLNAQPAAPPST